MHTFALFTCCDPDHPDFLASICKIHEWVNVPTCPDSETVEAVKALHPHAECFLLCRETDTAKNDGEGSRNAATADTGEAGGGRSRERERERERKREREQ